MGNQAYVSRKNDRPKRSFQTILIHTINQHRMTFQHLTRAGVMSTVSALSCPPPPLMKLSSPHPLPPPVLLAAVGTALAPPWVDWGWWLGMGSPLRFDDGVAIVNLLWRRAIVWILYYRIGVWLSLYDWKWTMSDTLDELGLATEVPSILRDWDGSAGHTFHVFGSWYYKQSPCKDDQCSHRQWKFDRLWITWL